jgi:hypothetical protein
MLWSHPAHTFSFTRATVTRQSSKFWTTDSLSDFGQCNYLPLLTVTCCCQCWSEWHIDCSFDRDIWIFWNVMTFSYNRHFANLLTLTFLVTRQCMTPLKDKYSQPFNFSPDFWPCEPNIRFPRASKRIKRYKYLFICQCKRHLMK